MSHPPGGAGTHYDARPALAAATEMLPDELGSAADRAAIVGVLDRLSGAPSTFVRSFGYECRLGRDEKRIDFAATVNPALSERAVLRDACPAAPAGASLTGRAEQTTDPWRGLRAFARRWSDVRSSIGQGVSLVFLEFDSPFGSDEPPALFARLDPTASAIADGWRRWGPLVREVVETVTGAPLAAAVEESLTQAVLCLPPGAHIADCATFTSRGDGAVRLFLLVPTHGVGAYLRAIGWPGSAARVEALVARHCVGIKRVPLHVDVADRVLPRIGIELGPDNPTAGPSSDLDPRGPMAGWQRTLDSLVADGWCDLEKRRAALRWPGRRAVPCGGRWPAVLHRRISHVKLVIDPEDDVRAKVYLWAMPAFALSA